MAGWRPRGGWRRRAPAFALLALALVPALALFLARPAPPDAPAAVAPAGETAPPDTPGTDTPSTDAPVPDPVPDAAPVPPPAAGARKAAAAQAPERWQGTPLCPRDRISGGQYNRCLYDNTRTSEQALEVEVANAIAVIEARTDLAGVQRAKWKSLLDESQSRFLLYRNFDCQSVAPFEGPRGIGNFEQRALCLIEANTRRARELKARYGSPMVQPEAPKGPQDRGGSWVHAVPPPVE